MKKILRRTLFMLNLIVLAGIHATAQESLTEKTTSIEIGNYKAFIDYRKRLIPADAAQNHITMDKTGIVFPSKVTYQFKKFEDGRIYEEGFLSDNKDKAAVFSWVSKSFDIYNSSGAKITSAFLKDFHPGREDGVTFTFSNTRIFLIPQSLYGCGGFEIRTSTGSLIKRLDICDLAGYAVSYDQRLFLVASMDPGPGTDGFFRVYDMGGNELWKHKISSAQEAKIELSYNNRFIAIKMPEYWIYPNKTDPYHATRKQNKLYLFDITKRILVSEEDYTP